MSFGNHELANLLSWMRNNLGLKTPYGYSAGRQPRAKFQYAESEESWARYQWNPPQDPVSPNSFPATPDPDASPKPTWQELLDAAQLREIDIAITKAKAVFSSPVTPSRRFGSTIYPANVRQELAGDDTLVVDGTAHHVHGGINRMTGLISMVEDANESGRHIPLIVMRDDMDEPIYLHTQQRVRPILDALRRRNNTIESAHNVVAEKFFAIIDQANNPNLPLPVRVQKARDADQFTQDYEMHLRAEIAKYNPDALPTDLDELKDVFVERLEAAALRRQRYIRGVLTEQGQKLVPSCNDEATALTKIAAEERDAAVAVFGSDDTDAATAAFNAGVAAISAVVPVRVPEFILNATPLGANPADQTLDSATFTVFADHPPSLNLDKPVGLRVSVSREGRKITEGVAITRSTPGDQETRRGATVTIDTAERGGQTIVVELLARSRCGPSALTIEMRVPSS